MAYRHLVSKDQINPPNQNNVDLHGRIPRKKPQLTKYNKQLNYAKARSILGESFMVGLNKNRDSGRCFNWHALNTAFEEKK